MVNKSLILIFLLVVTLGFGYELQSSYEIKERIDYNSGLVFLERWSNSYYLGIEDILTFEEYLDYQAVESMKKSWDEAQKQKRKKQESEFGAQGLIPDIEIPKLPIFGEGSRINISGSDKITFGGRQTTVYGEGITQSGIGASLLPELKMEQELRVNLDGSIGDKTKILIDHDSEREFEGKNKIKLSYTGTEDEIVQSIEMGDTRLTIPGTGYTGDLPAHKGLFGVSAKGKMGGLDLYAVASTEQSQAQTSEFRGRTQLATDTIYDHQFERKKFYIVDTLATQEVTNLQVYVDQKISNPQNYHKGLATIKPDSAADTTMGSNLRTKGKFILLKLGEDYYRHSLNVIELRYALYSNYVLAVSYISGSDTIGGNKYIETSQDTYVVLKLLKPSVLNNDSIPCWNYELRNIYSLGVKDVKLESLRLYRDEAATNDIELENQGPAKDLTFISILGLDPDGDGKITWPQFDNRNGLIIFPNRFPFANENLSEQDTIIYQQDPLPSGFLGKYYMAVRYSSAKESFYIGQTEIEEGSDRVYVNQDLWTRDVDYRINYITGELSFLRTLPPNADIRVTFEYRPWISASQKSLLGTRGEWKFSENGKIGSSIFYRSEGIPEEKPQLGAEPFRRMITEMDLSYSLSSQGLTSFLDKLPFLRAEAPSSFSFSSEGAISLPDPNTKGLVYLDDFEGSTISSDVRTEGIDWSFSSVPINQDTTNFSSTPINWFTPLTRIRKDSIFGADIGDEGRDMVEYLRIVFTPDNTSSWAGIMNCPSTFGMDFRDLENLEVVLRTRNRNSGKIHFTIGSSIDEDAPRRTRFGTIAGYNGMEDTEDRNQNGILDKVEGEDTGLDTILGSDTENVPGDDGNDDYDAETNPSGKEGNGGNVDTEDLDRNGFSRANDYFEYTIDLADPQFFQNLRGDWRFLRIPLLNSGIDTVVGNPRWEDIRLVRIWFDGFEQTDTIDIYTFSFVGSKWRNVEVKKNLRFFPNADTVDTTEKAVISQISIKTDTTYIPPFEAKRDYTGRLEIEASLNLAYEGIKPGHLVFFDKLIYDKEDYRDYKALRMYIHNDINDPVFFLRFGTDTNNYYEYRMRISEGELIPGRDNLWYEFEIPIDTFPILKNTLRTDTSYLQSDQFAVKGKPSLAEVRFQAMGIENHGNGPIDGAIWFNDIRLHNPRKEVGYGFQSRIGVKLSDFIPNLSFGISYSDPNFRRFSEGRGVKIGGFRTTTAFDAQINLHQLLPRSWNFNIPLGYRKSQDRSLLKFSSYYPDLRLTKTDAEKEATSGEATSWSLSNIHKRKSTNPFLNYTLEAFNYSWLMNINNSKTPLSVDSFYSVSSNLNYGISPDLNITLFGEEVNLFPQSIQAGVSVAKSSGPHWNRPHPDSTRWVLRSTDTTNTGSFDFDVNYNPLEDLSFDYNISQDRDLLVRNPQQIFGLKIGQDIGLEQNFGASYGMEIGEILSPRIDFNSDYYEDRIREVGGYSNLRNIGGGSDIDLSLDLELPEILAGAGKLRDETKDTLATPGSPNWLLIKIEDLSEILEPIDFGYSKSQNSEILNVRSLPDWKYRFGFVDNFAYETIPQPPSITRYYADNFQVSSGLNLKDLNFSIRFGHANDKTFYGASATGGRQTTWPDFSLSISRIERFFKNWATSSNISTGYSRLQSLDGSLDPVPDTFLLNGLISTVSNNFSPLLSWQVNWKKRISTNVSINYSSSKRENLDINTYSNSNQRSGTFSLSYSFSAPQGIRFPGLKKIRFSSDLSLSLSLRLSENYSDLFDPRIKDEPVVNRKDRDISTSISASYRVSRSVESGLTSGYSLYQNLQRKTNSRSIDLNFWILFRF